MVAISTVEVECVAIVPVLMIVLAVKVAGASRGTTDAAELTAHAAEVVR